MEVSSAAFAEKNVTYTSPTGEKKVLNINFDGLVDMAYDQAIADKTLVITDRNADGQAIDKNGNVIPEPKLEWWQRSLTESEYNKEKRAVSIAVSCAVGVALMAGGIGGMALASRAAKLAGQIIQVSSKAMTVDRVASAVGFLTQMAEGGVSIHNGVKSLEIAEFNQDTDKSRAEKRFMEAMLKEILQRMNFTADFIEQIISRLMQVFESMSTTQKGSDDAHASGAHNLVIHI
jgi:hypothetical protein